MTLQEVIDLITEKYTYAQTQNWITKPLAWAVYQAWKEVDERRLVDEDEECIAPEIIEFLDAVPDFTDRGIEHTAPCPCGGTIHAIRAKYNGHIRAWCDKCGIRMIE